MEVKEPGFLLLTKARLTKMASLIAATRGGVAIMLTQHLITGDLILY